MPSTERVAQLIEFASSGKIIEAMNEFYAENCSMQENDDTPTVGLQANIEREKAFMESVAEWHSGGVDSFAVDGDNAFLHWSMDITFKSGLRLASDQIAFQKWEGDKIVWEKFYYNTPHN